LDRHVLYHYFWRHHEYRVAQKISLYHMIKQSYQIAVNEIKFIRQIKV